MVLNGGAWWWLHAADVSKHQFMASTKTIDPSDYNITLDDRSYLSSSACHRIDGISCAGIFGQRTVMHFGTHAPKMR